MIKYRFTRMRLTSDLERYLEMPNKFEEEGYFDLGRIRKDPAMRGLGLLRLEDEKGASEFLSETITFLSKRFSHRPFLVVSALDSMRNSPSEIYKLKKGIANALDPGHAALCLTTKEDEAFPFIIQLHTSDIQRNSRDLSPRRGRVFVFHPSLELDTCSRSIKAILDEHSTYRALSIDYEPNLTEMCRQFCEEGVILHLSPIHEVVEALGPLSLLTPLHKALVGSA